ncbi:hypothetical protein AZE42_07010 [Rhizopogon vesiculosus]|uniref:Histone H1 n=1 Tax=Rhizopogon vesiculosus TaxID=180088 RepID=A0A1J8QKB5_9AGAM|nr:hypothetical protein AZE42_07010 [Rhizopogon vesiculosus]
MVTTSTPKKSSTKAADASAKSAQKTAASKTYHTTHPSWIDMITVGYYSIYCTHPFLGYVHSIAFVRKITPVSRSASPRRPMAPVTGYPVQRLRNLWIPSTILKSTPWLPANLIEQSIKALIKGDLSCQKARPSGKVKLAPRRHNEAAKENTKPASKRSTAKESLAASVKAAPKTAAKKSRAAKPVATTQPSASLKSGTEKKYNSTAKKAKATGTSTRRTAGRKATTARSTAKKTATGRTTAAKTKRGAAPAKRTTRAAASKQQRGKRISRK